MFENKNRFDRSLNQNVLSEMSLVAMSRWILCYYLLRLIYVHFDNTWGLRSSLGANPPTAQM